MIINVKNAKEAFLHEVYIHDDRLKQLIYHYREKQIVLSITDEINDNDIYYISFEKVIGFESTACEYWGPSPHILDFEYIEMNQRTLCPRLLNDFTNNADLSNSVLSKQNEYMELKITFTSGDRLVIVCESVIYNKPRHLD